MGLGNFWFGFLQRCRAYGAGKSEVAAVIFMPSFCARSISQIGKGYALIESKLNCPNRARPSRHHTLPIVNRTRRPFRGVNPFCQFVVARLENSFLFQDRFARLGFVFEGATLYGVDSSRNIPPSSTHDKSRPIKSSSISAW